MQKSPYKRRLPKLKASSACLSNGRKSVTALSPDYVLLDGDCQDNMDDYIISLAPRYSVPIIYLTIQHNNKYPMMQAGAIDVVYKPDGTPSDNERFSETLCRKHTAP